MGDLSAGRAAVCLGKIFHCRWRLQWKEESTNKRVKQAGEGACQFQWCAEYRQGDAVFVADGYRAVFVMFVQFHEIPLVENPVSITECSLQDDGGFVTFMSVGRSFAASNQFLQNHPPTSLRKFVGNVQHADIAHLPFPGQVVDVLPQ